MVRRPDGCLQDAGRRQRGGGLFPERLFLSLLFTHLGVGRLIPMICACLIRCSEFVTPPNLATAPPDYLRAGGLIAAAVFVSSPSLIASRRRSKPPLMGGCVSLPE